MRAPTRRFAIPASLAIVLGGAAMATTAVAQSGGRVDATTTPIGTTTSKVVPLIAADMNGTKEGVNSAPAGPPAPAAGEALVTVDPITKEVCVNITTTGIGAYTGLHIHSGAATTTGPVVIDFAPPAGTTGSYAKCVTDDDAVGLAADPASFYLNVHTADFPTGALRDQLAIRTSETQMLATPQRAYDSRQGTDGKLTGSATRVVDLSKFGVPIGARAAIVNLTAAATVGNGYLTIYSNALTTVPATSTVNFFPGSDVANETIVAVDGAGKVKVAVGPVGQTDVIIDVVGYLV